MGLAVVGLLVFGIVILSAVTDGRGAVRTGRRRAGGAPVVPASTVRQVQDIINAPASSALPGPAAAQPTGLTDANGHPIVVAPEPPVGPAPAVDLSEQHGGAVITPPTPAVAQRRIGTADVVKAKNMAGQVTSNLRTAGRGGYDHNLLRTFQRYAGLAADGAYGPRTHGALVYFRTSPPPVFTGRGTVRYRPVV